MHAKCFLDITALGASEDMPHYAVLSKAMHILHGSFTDCDGQYAVSFPDSKQGKNRAMGGTIRVFAESAMDLYSLIEKVKGHHLMRDYTQMSMPKDVPEGFSGTWTVWRRARLQKCDGSRKEEALKRVQDALFFEMISSNGNSFPLRVYKEAGHRQVEGFKPNSYGFASWTNFFALPDL